MSNSSIEPLFNKAELSDGERILNHMYMTRLQEMRERGSRCRCASFVYDRSIRYSQRINSLPENYRGFMISFLGVEGEPMPLEEAKNKYGLSEQEVENIIRFLKRCGQDTSGYWVRPIKAEL